MRESVTSGWDYLSHRSSFPMSLHPAMVSLHTRTLASSTVSSDWSLSAHVDMFKSEMTLVSEIQLEDVSQ